MTPEESEPLDPIMDEKIEEHRNRLRSGGFGIALSGGGHRATLMTLGALMAIVDRGLNRNVLQISSVSGGSITNAFIAQRCDYADIAPGELDCTVGELAKTVVRRGVLTHSWIIAIIGCASLGGAGIGMLASVLANPAVAVIVGLVVAFALLMGSGLLIESLLDHRYLRPSRGREADAGPARIRSMTARKVDHVLCMTDLVLGLPVYVSMKEGGVLWRRLGPEPPHEYESPKFQTFEIGNNRLAEFVRASAAFPGIPPRRFRMPSDPKVNGGHSVPSFAFLADGGLWNNLGSQVAREDRFLGGYWDRDADGTIRPIYGRPTSSMPLLVVNGSAPQRPSKPILYQIPGIALLCALTQGARILNSNTVVPREISMRRSFWRQATAKARPGQSESLDLVVDLETPTRTLDFYRYAISEDLIRESIGSYPVIGLADMDEYDAIIDSEAWKRIAREEENIGGIRMPTTLGRVDASVARHLIARGYANTFLVSLYLGPLGKGDLNWLEQLPDRLRSIVPGND